MRNKAKIENLLKQSRLISSINANHKRDVWLALTSKTKTPFFLQKRIWAMSFATLTMLIIMILNLKSSNVIGHSECVFQTSESKPLHHGILYETDQHDVMIKLEDKSRIKLSPHSTFTIKSSSTDRKTMDTLIVLDQGTMEASVIDSLPNDLLVQTPNIEVKVIGTKFTIRVSEFVE